MSGNIRVMPSTNFQEVARNDTEARMSGVHSKALIHARKQSQRGELWMIWKLSPIKPRKAKLKVFAKFHMNKRCICTNYPLGERWQHQFKSAERESRKFNFK